MKEIILSCLIIITLISGCIQNNSTATPTSTSTPTATSTHAAPTGPSLSLTINPNPAMKGTKVPIIVKLLSSKGEPISNELIYINLTREFERLESQQIYTNTDGNAILNYDTSSIPSDKSCDTITISILWRNSTGYGSISTERNLDIYTEGPHSVQSFSLYNPGVYYNPPPNEAYLYLTATIFGSGNLYNLGPINFTATQGNESNSIIAYTNCYGQASVKFTAKPGFVKITATYQNFSKTVNTTITAR
jgi:hypothetical protein